VIFIFSMNFFVQLTPCDTLPARQQFLD